MNRESKNIYDKYTGVIELTPKDFKIEKNKVKITNKEFKNKNGLITFYAPWCIHCKNMKEMWSDFAIDFKHKFPIAAVNCENSKNMDICNKLRIGAYPTIMRTSKKGNINNYKGHTGKDDMLYYICTKL